jgi:uncharacterized repeat protein (TIGR01451 family)
MKKLSILSLLLFGAMLLTSTAYAAGTLAGKVITNQAYVDYKDANDNSLARAFSNAVTITVSQVASISIQPDATTQIGANGATAVFLVQIFNTGNGDDTFNFAVNQGAGWTPDSIKLYHDVNQNHTYDPGIDTLITPVVGQTYKSNLTVPDDDFDILMVVQIPAIVTDGSTSIINITATSLFNQSVTASGSYTTKISTAVVNAVTTHPEKLPKPGDIVTFTTVVKNTGSSVGTSSVLTNLIPANMTYVPGSVTINGVLMTDAKDGDTSNYNVDATNTITATLGTLASGSTTTVVFKAMVNPGTLATTLLSEEATVAYTAGVTPLTIKSTLDTDVVAILAYIAMTPATQSLNGNPGDVKIYQVTLTSTGNAADTVTLKPTSAAGWTWAIWVDGNNNGIAGDASDKQLVIGSSGASITVQPNQVVNLLAIATVPVGTPDRTIDNTTLAGVSGLDVTKTAQVSFATTATAPVFSLVKTVSPTGSQPPGTTLVYTVSLSNTGSGLANHVIVTDPIPQYTTFVANSLKTGTTIGTLAAKTDAPDGDGAMYDSNANAVVMGSATAQLPAGASIVLQFSTKIN